MTKRIVLCLGLLLGAAGCTNNLTKLSDDALYARTTTANEARMTPEGNLQASYQGIGASQIMQDPNGNWAQMQGPVAIMSVPLPGGGIGYIISPKDTKIARLCYTPNPAAGQAEIVLEGLEANISTPMAQEVAALEKVMVHLTTMNKDAILGDIGRMKAAGEMLPTIADALVAIISKFAPVP